MGFLALHHQKQTFGSALSYIRMAFKLIINVFIGVTRNELMHLMDREIHLHQSDFDIDNSCVWEVEVQELVVSIR